MSTLFHDFYYSEEVADNLRSNHPVVALESTVLTHGLPHPQNLETAIAMEEQIRKEGSCPATIAILNGKVHVGLTIDQLSSLTSEKEVRKVSLRDIATSMLKKEFGGTTVAGTLYIAHKSGIKVFATGGIGGVHPDGDKDISADLPALGKYPVIVVCSGAKAILNLPATIEVLETLSVPVIGYQTDELPAFYSIESGLPVSARIDSPKKVMEFAAIHWELGLSSSILVTVPPPLEFAIPSTIVAEYVKKASAEAGDLLIHGQELTPYILSRLSSLSDGVTLRTNIKLLVNNARIASQIACSGS
ncbi:MAG TPA: pseudouridine-5'-phosphate glycosidase [Anaerolineales bacterium]|nr:pseudouridine-5'-phosphate glycosidase [Anaerolineales bacterium]